MTHNTYPNSKTQHKHLRARTHALVVFSEWFVANWGAIFNGRKAVGIYTTNGLQACDQSLRCSSCWRWQTGIISFCGCNTCNSHTPAYRVGEGVFVFASMFVQHITFVLYNPTHYLNVWHVCYTYKVTPIFYPCLTHNNLEKLILCFSSYTSLQKEPTHL